jgi:hypothetical protein
LQLLLQFDSLLRLGCQELIHLDVPALEFRSVRGLLAPVVRAIFLIKFFVVLCRRCGDLQPGARRWGCAGPVLRCVPEGGDAGACVFAPISRRLPNS